VGGDFPGIGRHSVVIIDHGGGTPWLGSSCHCSSYWLWSPPLPPIGQRGGSSALSFDRETALRSADLIDNAEQAVAGGSRNPKQLDVDDLNQSLRLLQMVRIRCQPLKDGDLDDRITAAAAYAFDSETWKDDPGGRRWMGEAIATYEKD